MRTYTIEKPIWYDIVTKNRIVAKFIYEDGEQCVASFPVEEENPDYKLFLETFTLEDVDTNTEEVRATEAARREKDSQIKAERDEQAKLNKLFNAKIEAFELPIIQNASIDLKAKIRKATTPFEVTAIVAAIMIKSGVLDEPEQTTE